MIKIIIIYLCFLKIKTNNKYFSKVFQISSSLIKARANILKKESYKNSSIINNINNPFFPENYNSKKIENNVSSIININFNYSFVYKRVNHLRKNLLIGAISNYRWEDVALFFKSYFKAGFSNCDCVMFVSNMLVGTIDKIKSYGIIVFNTPDKYKSISIINYRWKIYEDFLNDNKDKYSLVFTADLRDTVFRKDIF